MQPGTFEQWGSKTKSRGETKDRGQAWSGRGRPQPAPKTKEGVKNEDILESVYQQPVTNSAAAAKSLQSCPTLRDPIDGSPPGSTVPGILQARTLEWVAISFRKV